MNTNVKRSIAQADTVEKVWALVATLLQDGNNYSDKAYLDNAKAYAALATKMIAKGEI